MDTIKVRFVTGPAYFGEPRLARDVLEIILQAAMGNTRKIVTFAETTDDPKIGIFAEIEATAHPDTKKQVQAAIYQAMLLPERVPCEISFEETDVMLPDYFDELHQAVLDAQKGLKDGTDRLAEHIMWGYY